MVSVSAKRSAIGAAVSEHYMLDRNLYVGPIAMIPWPVGGHALYTGLECRSAAVGIMQSRIHSSVYIFSAPLAIEEVGGLG